MIDTVQQELVQAEPVPLETIDVLDLLLTLCQVWRQILLGGAIGLTLAVLYAFLLAKPTYTATAIILPPQQSQSSASALLGSLNALSGIAGASGLGLKSPGDLYVGILESRTVADRVIEKFHLQRLYHAKTLDDARVRFGKQVRSETTKDGLIHVNAQAREAKLAADLANAVVNELYQMNSQLAVTEASQRRLFFEQQVTAEKAELQHSEDELRATQEKTGVIQLAGQSEAIIRAISTQQAEIASREVELKSMETFATDQNPQMAMRRQEIAAMKEQLAKMENSQGQTGGGDILVPSGKVPAAGLEYSRKLRDFKFHESLFELLTRQYEAARIDEAKSAPLIQVVDRAVPPQKMSAPARTLIVIGGFLLGIAASIGLRFAQIGARNMMSDPARADKVRAIASAFRSGQQSAAAENAR